MSAVPCAGQLPDQRPAPRYACAAPKSATVAALTPATAPSRYIACALVVAVRATWCHLPSLTFAAEIIGVAEPVHRPPYSLPSVPTYSDGAQPPADAKPISSIWVV